MLRETQHVQVRLGLNQHILLYSVMFYTRQNKPPSVIIRNCHMSGCLLRVEGNGNGQKPCKWEDVP